MFLKAGKVYKIIAITNKEVGGLNGLRLYPLADTGPIVDVICLYQAMFADQFAASGFVSRMVRQ